MPVKFHKPMIAPAAFSSTNGFIFTSSSAKTAKEGNLAMSGQAIIYYTLQMRISQSCLKAAADSFNGGETNP